MRVPVHPVARQLLDEELEPPEFDERLRAALADEDRMAELVALIAWFRRRYPTAAERLAYARRRYLEIAARGGPRPRTDA